MCPSSRSLLPVAAAFLVMAGCSTDSDSVASHEAADVSTPPPPPAEETIDPGELQPSDDPEHLAIFPTEMPTAEWTPRAVNPEVTEHPHDHEHDYGVEVADPDDPYPIEPPNLDEVDASDPQQVAGAFGCHWFVWDEDSSITEKLDRLTLLATDELATELDVMSGHTQPGEWYEAELLEVTADEDSDDWRVMCHTRDFAADEFARVAYDRVVVVTVTDADGDWQVTAFDPQPYTDWHPTEQPPGH